MLGENAPAGAATGHKDSNKNQKIDLGPPKRPLREPRPDTRARKNQNVYVWRNKKKLSRARTQGLEQNKKVIVWREKKGPCGSHAQTQGLEKIQKCFLGESNKKHLREPRPDTRARQKSKSRVWAEIKQQKLREPRLDTRARKKKTKT